jgi:UDPglucose 6-dehydrogenase
MEPSVAIVGYGSLGRALHVLFPSAVVYDEPLGIGERAEVNRCDFVCVAVPTPEGADGACDTSIIESVVRWLNVTTIILFSTVAVGTTERLVRETGKRIVHQPTYGPGDTPEHPFGDLRKQRWIILGGERRHTVPVADLYKRVYNADTVIVQTDAKTAELTKYMENAYLAMKVSFCNEMYDIANAVGVDYNELRELWLLDPRLGRSHSFVFPDDRGYGGKCLPKDVAALIHTAEENGVGAPLLKGMAAANQILRAQTTSDSKRFSGRAE